MSIDRHLTRKPIRLPLVVYQFQRGPDGMPCLVRLVIDAPASEPDPQTSDQ
jgi:hypothetical protein